MDLPEFLNSEAELDGFLRGFAAGTLPKEMFTHAAHIAMAACYCLQFPEGESLDRARRDIRHFNESVGGANTDESGYHETVTRFWMEAVRGALEPGRTRLEQVRRVVQELAGRRDLVQRRYSYDVVRSKEARRRWMAPDLEPS